MSQHHITVTVTSGTHTHAGRAVTKGSRLHVDAATAQWLIDNKIAAPAKPADSAQPTPKKDSKA